MKKSKIMLPSEEIRQIYQERKIKADRNEFDEIDMLFGSCSVVEKSIIEYLDQRFKQVQEIVEDSNK